MNMKVTNKKISVEQIDIGGVSRSSIVLIGDTEIIRCSSIFDTPEHSLHITPQLPLKPTNHPPIYEQITIPPQQPK
ncbi:hypothetical protein [Ammoniphilus resinae]|uniref:Spore germination protein PD n=1 Tax=Ammoniphilus resinae TaxID=861532 RepID=A0ABS4GQA2_9BACL|nr:hypothetical protein [Ammoniphilus resinae]MBP1932401.1 spore germination protein PD [Ammoniphilus resinae]